MPIASRASPPQAAAALLDVGLVAVGGDVAVGVDVDGVVVSGGVSAPGAAGVVGGDDDAGGVVAAAAGTVTASFMPLPQWPAVPQMK